MTKEVATRHLSHTRQSLDTLREIVKSYEDSMNRSKKIYEDNKAGYEMHLTELREQLGWVNFLEQQIEKLPE